MDTKNKKPQLNKAIPVELRVILIFGGRENESFNRVRKNFNCADCNCRYPIYCLDKK